MTNKHEVVRSDRNLYSSYGVARGDALTKNYTRMTHQVEQLKEALKQKYTQLVHQDILEVRGREDRAGQGAGQAEDPVVICKNRRPSRTATYRAAEVPDRAGAEAETVDGLGDGRQRARHPRRVAHQKEPVADAAVREAEALAKQPRQGRDLLLRARGRSGCKFS